MDKRHSVVVCSLALIPVPLVAGAPSATGEEAWLRTARVAAKAGCLIQGGAGTKWTACHMGRLSGAGPLSGDWMELIFFGGAHPWLDRSG